MYIYFIDYETVYEQHYIRSTGDRKIITIITTERLKFGNDKGT